MPRFFRVEPTLRAGINKQACILFVTATPIETEALHAALRPLPNFKRRLTITSGAQTYYIGKFGKYGIIHVQSQMGSATTGGASVTVAEALTFWDIKGIIMVGIAFGVDNKSQRIGDVLISKSVQQYEMQRVGKKQNTLRGNSASPGAILLNRFTNSRGWKFSVSPKKLPLLNPSKFYREKNSSIISNLETNS